MVKNCRYFLCDATFHNFDFYLACFIMSNESQRVADLKVKESDLGCWLEEDILKMSEDDFSFYLETSGFLIPSLNY